jgi:uncharacterized membrane protein SpoIIM required for sporulation
MTPLHFEQTYQAEWTELEALLEHVLGRTRDAPPAADPAARLPALYRRACEHLALARARAYPAPIVDRLERVTADAHQVIYQRRELSVSQLRDLALTHFPAEVRRQRWYVAVAALVFVVPTLVLGLLVHARPDLILSVVSAETAASFEDLYSTHAESIGRTRTASNDWVMFGFYIRNNVGVSFQCFAGGVFAGLGTLFFLAYNGAFAGALAGFLTSRGLSSTFFSFVATHSAFELTAIVLSGAAGLRIGHALVAPGRLSRREALVGATRESAVLLYGVTALLVIAAAVEAFWSSARWLPVPVKYLSAAICWTAMFAYLSLQGRRAD